MFSSLIELTMFPPGGAEWLTMGRNTWSGFTAVHQTVMFKGLQGN